MILNLPSNPTASVYIQAGLSALADVLRRHPRVLVLGRAVEDQGPPAQVGREEAARRTSGKPAPATPERAFVELTRKM